MFSSKLLQQWLELMNIQSSLFELQDPNYGDFQAKLIPNIPRSTIIGIRVPRIRELAKSCIKDPQAQIFIQTLPHQYMEEYMLHSFIIAEIKDFQSCIVQTERLLPYVDNWAVCDSFSPRIFKKYPDELIKKITEWTYSKHVFTSRFGIKMLMSHFLDRWFKTDYLDIPIKICTEEYYLKMMIAWFYATALAKQWDAAIPYIEQHRLPPWIHQKTIQKSIESFRIAPDQKTYLRTLK